MLTSKQQAFVEHFVITGNALQSARDAGYSESTALAKSSSWLENVGIQQAIASKKRALEIAGKSQNVTPDWVISKLAERAADDTSPASSVSALRTLADILGMTAGARQQAPAGYTELMEALARGLAQGAQAHAIQQSRTLEILPSSLPGDSEQDA